MNDLRITSFYIGLFYCLNDNYCDVHYGKGK